MTGYYGILFPREKVKELQEKYCSVCESLETCDAKETICRCNGKLREECGKLNEEILKRRG